MRRKRRNARAEEFLCCVDSFAKDFESLKDAAGSFYSHYEAQKEKIKILIEGLINFYEQLEALKETPERLAFKEEINLIFKNSGIFRWAPREGENAGVDCQKVIAKENKKNLGNNQVASVIRYGWKMKEPFRQLIIREPVVEVVKEEEL